MSWLQRGSSASLIAACALFAYAAGDPTRVANAEPSFSSRADERYGTEQRADELYLDAVEKLDAGHPDFARELFQSVVERYPMSSAAERARGALTDLARNDAARHADASPPARLDGTPPMTTGSITAPELPDAPAALPVPGIRTPVWDIELRRNASIQSKLRVEAGDRVFFSPGSADLGSRARTALSAQAQWLMRWHEFEAAIEGHADEPGSEQENVVLSQQRAEAVRQRLIEEGVEPDRLAVVPLGRSVRVATCADTDCRAQNRRAVTLVFATGTRDRLGLNAGAPRAAAVSFAPGNTAPAATARQAGVTR
ncbi:OmpA family protein [Hyphomicrobium sp. xq]|uniref:OmpA family protein n=1 Tax=Hyphomicrobium album TaxID=2665159 RepID=A0A6I3KNQ6_9HYPH|nr:OmpA family protein [Hyphomicrobium album]MTD95948.1 OmpA family protein [Hyphomicrobium album]